MTRQDLEALSCVAVRHWCGHRIEYAVWLGDRTPAQFRADLVRELCPGCRRKRCRKLS